MGWNFCADTRSWHAWWDDNRLIGSQCFLDILLASKSWWSWIFSSTTKGRCQSLFGHLPRHSGITDDKSSSKANFNYIWKSPILIKSSEQLNLGCHCRLFSMSAAEYTSLSRADRADIYEYIGGWSERFSIDPIILYHLGEQRSVETVNGMLTDMHEVISSVHSYCLFTGWDLVTAGAIDEESFDDPYPRRMIHSGCWSQW